MDSSYPSLEAAERGAYSQPPTWFKARRFVTALRDLGLTWPRLPLGSLVEMGLIVLWAVWVGRPLLNFDPAVWLINVDFIMNTFPYYAWSLLAKCGTCVLWNGYINGGIPTLVDLVGAVHPLMSAIVVTWGVINGAKSMLW